MTGLALSLALQAALLSGGAHPYDEAFRTASAGGPPLLVLVGADWCPGCRTMKQNVLASMQQSGRLKDVNYAAINTDVDSKLASRLMRGNTIPQLIVFSKTETGWHREQITGATSEANVAALIGRAVAAQAAVKKNKPEITSAAGN